MEGRPFAGRFCMTTALLIALLDLDPGGNPASSPDNSGRSRAAERVAARCLIGHPRSYASPTSGFLQPGSVGNPVVSMSQATLERTRVPTPSQRVDRFGGTP